MALTRSLVRQFVSRGVRERWWDITFDSSYPVGGESLTASDLGLNVVQFANATPQTGYVFEYDYTNSKLQVFRSAGFTPAGTFTGTAPAGTAGTVNDSDTAATDGHALYVVRDSAPETLTVVAEASATGLIIDSDTAATEGVQIYLVIDDAEYLPSFQLGHLEFVSPTNAHGSCTVANGLGTLLIEDDDAAATNGVEVRAIAASGGLEATIAGSNGTALVPLSDGQFLHIADSTTGSTPAVYFDEDAANTYERLRAVVVDNANEPYKLAEVVPAVSRPGVFSSSRLASLVSVAPGDSVSQGTVGAAGPEFDVIHDGAAAQMVGAAVLYAEPAGAGLAATLPGGEDVFIPTSTGEFIRVAHSASPTGVQVYWDHDAANTEDRMVAVVVDNADETFSTEAALGWTRDTPAGTFSGTAVAEGVLAEVDEGTNLSALVTRLYANGK